MIEIKSITIILSNGTDKIMIKSDLPTTYPNVGYGSCLLLDCQYDYGIEYCKNNFPGVPLEVINTRF